MAAKERFGEVAVRLGYVTPKQVQEALLTQKELAGRGVRRLIGMVLLDRGFLGTTELIGTLQAMAEQDGQVIQ